MEKIKKLNNFQESTIEEIYTILNGIQDAKTWKNVIHEMTKKDNLI